MAYGGIRHFTHEDRWSVFVALRQVDSIYVVEADLDSTIHVTVQMGIVWRISLASSDICQSNVHMVEVDAPAVFGNKTLSGKVLTIGIELKGSHRTTTSATGEHNTD